MLCNKMRIDHILGLSHTSFFFPLRGIATLYIVVKEKSNNRKDRNKRQLQMEKIITEIWLCVLLQLMVSVKC